MAKSFKEAYLDSTDVLRDIYDHHTGFLGDAVDILENSKVTEALHNVTISSGKYRDAAQMHLEFAATSHAAIGGLDIGPEREQVVPKIYEGARQTYDHLNDHLDAMGALAQSHHWTLGEQHPLTQHIIKNYHGRKSLIGQYADAWGFRDRFDFDDVIKNSNLNGNQFGGNQ
jgi:hypothetical protein